MAMKNSKMGNILSWVLVITAWTFFLAVVVGVVSQLLIQEIHFLPTSLFVMALIIATGVFFDTIGTAVAAADEGPLNAKAARKEYGAKMGVYLVQRADQVANFTNDVVGDITGIVSGLIGGMIVLRFVNNQPSFIETYFSIVVTAFIAALTVGGKAYGKTLAINYSTEIVLYVGKLLTRAAEILVLCQLFGRILNKK